MAGAVFVFHPGHWGSTVGFYGGVNYGYGYFGNGYSGGHWVGNSFAYNSAVNHVDAAVAHHTYAQSVPGQAPRGVLSYSARPRNGDSARTASAHRSPAGAVKTTRSAVDGAGETTATKAERPVAVTKTPAAVASPKSSKVTASRAAPTKQ
jgi:hypothetical protein